MASHSEFKLENWAGRRMDIESAIHEDYAGNRDDSPHRHHLGASDIGNVCPRHSWYTYRHVKAKEFPPRLYKVFDTGHRAEPIIAADMKRAGCEISTDTGDGETQYSFTSYGGHVTVNLDGIGHIPDKLPLVAPIVYLKMIVEMKTMSLKRFKTLCSKGIQDACPEYYRQMQTQLHVASKCNEKFDGAFFIALCKDTDEYFIYEVEHDLAMQQKIREEIIRLLKGEVPERLNLSEKTPPCRFCDYLTICKHDRYDLIEKNCRTCNNAEMVLKSDNESTGTWACRKGHDFGVVCNDWCQYIGF